MLDLGWSEMAIIATVALFVIGPKDLPKALRTAGRYGGKVKALAREFQSSIDEAVKEAEKDLHLEEVKRAFNHLKTWIWTRPLMPLKNYLSQSYQQMTPPQKIIREIKTYQMRKPVLVHRL